MKFATYFTALFLLPPFLKGMVFWKYAGGRATDLLNKAEKSRARINQVVAINF